jgi:hypothetical protein
MKFKLFFAAVALTAIGCWGGYLLVFPQTTVNYRIEIELEIEGQPVELSSIWQVKYISQPALDGLLPSLTAKIFAQAAHARLPDGRLVFLAIADMTFTQLSVGKTAWGNVSGIPVAAMGLKREEGPAIVRAMRAASSAGSSYPLDRSTAPPIWVLPDEAVKGSIDPVRFCEEGMPCDARLIAGKITFTDEQPSIDIFKIFPWIADWNKSRPLFYLGDVNDFD